MKLGNLSAGEESGIPSVAGSEEHTSELQSHLNLVCRLLLEKMTVLEEEAPANYVPAAAVIRRGLALSGITGRKGCVGGFLSQR